MIALISTHDVPRQRQSSGTEPQHESSPRHVPLHELPPGTEATVVSLTGDPAARWRMLDLGLVPGTAVTVLRRSPLGDPTLYGFRGTMIALRKQDAAGVLVQPKQAVD